MRYGVIQMDVKSPVDRIITYLHLERNKIFILLRSSAVLLNGIIAVRWKQQNYGCCCVWLSDPLLLSSDLPRPRYHKLPYMSTHFSACSGSAAFELSLKLLVCHGIDQRDTLAVVVQCPLRTASSPSPSKKRSRPEAPTSAKRRIWRTQQNSVLFSIGTKNLVSAVLLFLLLQFLNGSLYVKIKNYKWANLWYCTILFSM